MPTPPPQRWLPEWARRLLTSPVGELTRFQRAVRYAIDLAIHCAVQLRRDRAQQMAAALTYRTIFSLIPIAVLSLLMFRAFVGLEHIQQDAQQWAMRYLGLTTITYPEAADGGPPRTAPAQQPAASEDGGEAAPGDGNGGATDSGSDRRLRSTVANRIAKLTREVASLDFRSIGTVGIAVLIWAALALVISLEQSCNQIFGAVAGRSITMRIVLYWTVLTLGPMLLLISLYMAGRLVEGAQQLPVAGQVVGFFSRFTALAASWALLAMLYLLMPNTRVAVRPALIGSFVAACLWETGKWGFGLYVGKTLPYSTLYGSLGLIPLFLLWVYVTWLIVLFGLELTYALQTMPNRSLEQQQAWAKREESVVDPAWVLPVAAHIGAAFDRGRVCGADEVARLMNLTPGATARLIEPLERAGLIRPVHDAGHDGYTLARPAGRITVAELLDAIAPDDPTGGEGTEPRAWDGVREIRRLQREYGAETPLSALIEPERATDAAADQAAPEARHAPTTL